MIDSCWQTERIRWNIGKSLSSLASSLFYSKDVNDMSLSDSPAVSEVSGQRVSYWKWNVNIHVGVSEDF